MIDVEAVLRRLGIEAKKRGREFEALCPSPEHEDRRPSWRIRDEPGSRRHGMHHCWPCGFGGTIERLVMAVRGVRWHEAAEWLAGDEAAAPVAESLEWRGAPLGRAMSRWQGAGSHFTMPAGVEFLPWERWPTTARRYAASRGITEEQVLRWGIGVAVGGRLDGRIVFAKRNALGVPVGYSARTYVGDRVRYREAEPWEGAAPDAVFGEEYWPAPPDGYPISWDLHRVLHVAEGAINALALERAGAAYVATTSGSQLHPAVAAKIATFVGVVVVSDPDAAGDELATSVTTAVARFGAEVRRVRLPAGEDAASLPLERLKEELWKSTG